MTEPMRTSRLAALAVLAFVLFNYPLLAVFDSPTRVFGVPLLWVYLFSGWALVLALVAWVTRDS